MSKHLTAYIEVKYPKEPTHFIEIYNYTEKYKNDKDMLPMSSRYVLEIKYLKTQIDLTNDGGILQTLAIFKITPKKQS